MRWPFHDLTVEVIRGSKVELQSVVVVDTVFDRADTIAVAPSLFELSNDRSLVFFTSPSKYLPNEQTNFVFDFGEWKPILRFHVAPFKNCSGPELTALPNSVGSDLRNCEYDGGVPY